MIRPIPPARGVCRVRHGRNDHTKRASDLPELGLRLGPQAHGTNATEP